MFRKMTLYSAMQGVPNDSNFNVLASDMDLESPGTWTLGGSDREKRLTEGGWHIIGNGVQIQTHLRKSIRGSTERYRDYRRRRAAQQFINMWVIKHK